MGQNPGTVAIRSWLGNDLDNISTYTDYKWLRSIPLGVITIIINISPWIPMYPHCFQYQYTCYIWLSSIFIDILCPHEYINPTNISNGNNILFATCRWGSLDCNKGTTPLLPILVLLLRPRPPSPPSHVPISWCSGPATPGPELHIASSGCCGPATPGPEHMPKRLPDTMPERMSKNAR